MTLDKRKIKQSFAAASKTYDSVAALQRTVGTELLELVRAEQLSGTLLDVGCGTGFLTQGLIERAKPRALDYIIALDIALPMLHSTRAKLARDNVLAVCADAENLPLTARCVHNIFSNLALQWCRNLDAVFAQFKRVLVPDGALIFSTFGTQTLQELKAAWAAVDDYEHVNDFYDQQQLIDFLQAAGFTVCRIDSTLHVPRYDSVFALMYELKHIGAHNVMSGRNKHITSKATLRAMIAAYEQHKMDGQIPATFEIIRVVARG